jgi:hypothetical protein
VTGLLISWAAWLRAGRAKTAARTIVRSVNWQTTVVAYEGELQQIEQHLTQASLVGDVSSADMALNRWITAASKLLGSLVDIGDANEVSRASRDSLATQLQASVGLAKVARGELLAGGISASVDVGSLTRRAHKAIRDAVADGSKAAAQVRAALTVEAVR